MRLRGKYEVLRVNLKRSNRRNFLFSARKSETSFLRKYHLKENTPVKPARPESPEGALGTLPVGVSSESSVKQNQQNVKSNVKYSIGGSGIVNSFRHPFDTLVKKFGVNNEKIKVAENQEENELGLKDNVISSPSRIAEKCISRCKTLI